MVKPSDLAWEQLTTQVAYRCPGFEIINEDVRLPDGTETDFDYLSEPPAVVILPFVDTETLVVIDEWREPVDRINRGLPAGTVEDGESPLTAARRELREETGYEAADIRPLVTVEPANGVADSVHHYFVATGCQPDREQRLDIDETIQPTEVDFEAFTSAVLGGTVRDGRAVLGLCYYLASDEETAEQSA